MQSFQLLGGKYQQGEQILPGVIQTFRSYEVPTGRPVFIHRMAAKDPAAREVADLLSAGLIHSPVVRRMLLDVYESEEYRFVVTEPARECVPLRGWLEGEVDEEPEGGAKPAPVRPSNAAAPVAVPEPPVPPVARIAEAEPLPEAPSEEEAMAIERAGDADTTEFARLFHEALAGKSGRSKRKNAPEDAVPSKPAVLPLPMAPPVLPHVEPPIEPPATAAPSPAVERDLFQVVESERAGRSRLAIVLVVFAVLALLLVMFVVVFVTR